ncbi:MAG: COP23 domain-containing protein [Coleofasciculaceae cyanobacterium]
MKSRSFASLITFFAFLPTVIFPSVSYAEETTFFCGTTEGVPATIARTSQGEVAMVLWSAEQLNQPDSNPEQLCQEASQRFQTYYNQGKLNYITTGRVNRQNVACVAQQEGGACNGFLFALNPEIKPKVALQRMFRIRVPSAGPISETGTPLYINLERYFNGEYPSTTPTHNNRSRESQSEELQP